MTTHTLRDTARDATAFPAMVAAAFFVRNAVVIAALAAMATLALVSS
jgi:hypothetical protein